VIVDVETLGPRHHTRDATWTEPLQASSPLGSNR
jgi:hypothetical protein